MSTDPYTDKIFVLDALTHGLNISLFELMSILSAQAPLSNLLLVPALKLPHPPMSTLIPVPSIDVHQKILAAAAPTAGAVQAAAPQTCPEKPDEGYLAFIVIYWVSLAFVICVAVAAVLTKLMMSVHKSQSERKAHKALTKPMTDVERWCVRRQKMREWEKEMREMREAEREAESE